MPRLLMIAMLAIVGSLRPADAQMIHSTVPFQNLGSSFYEANSMGGSLAGRNWFANFGGGGPLLPPFGDSAGGGVVGGGLSGGIGFAGGGVSGNLRFNFAQGSSRSISSSTPSLTTINGYPGSFSSTVTRPFVTGVTPVVGGYPTIVSPSAEIRRQQLSALQQSQAELNNRKLQQYLRRVERAESNKNVRMARANLRLAIAIAGEPLRSQLQQRMRALVSESRQR